MKRRASSEKLSVHCLVGADLSLVVTIWKTGIYVWFKNSKNIIPKSNQAKEDN
jgi:hypothetical protein